MAMKNKGKFRWKIWAAMKSMMLDISLHKSGWHEPIKSYIRYTWRKEKRHYQNKKWHLYQKEA